MRQITRPKRISLDPLPKKHKVATSKESNTRQLPDLEKLGIRTFDKEYKELLKLTKAKNFSGDQSSYVLLRSLLAMIVQMMPKVEETFYKYPNERAVYATVALAGKAQELAADLRSLGDHQALASRISEGVIQKALNIAATAIIQDLIATKRSMNDLPPKAASKLDNKLDDIQRRITNHLQLAYLEANTTLNNILMIK